jgi:hypothetical protein
VLQHRVSARCQHQPYLSRVARSGSGHTRVRAVARRPGGQRSGEVFVISRCPVAGPISQPGRCHSGIDREAPVRNASPGLPAGGCWLRSTGQRCCRKIAPGAHHPGSSRRKARHRLADHLVKPSLKGYRPSLGPSHGSRGSHRLYVAQPAAPEERHQTGFPSSRLLTCHPLPSLALSALLNGTG